MKKKKKEKPDYDNPQLPEEIIMEIFTKLPTKSVGRCRCLSKSWRAHLADPQFIKKHLIATLKTNQPHNLILKSFTGNAERFYTVSPPLTDNAVATELQNTLASIKGSCNGLVLFATKVEYPALPDMFLTNPTTRQLVKFLSEHKA